MYKQLEFDFGVSEEQACIMCHLSSECSGCCRRCKKKTCEGQACSLPFIDNEKARWNNWMYLVAKNLPHLEKFIPPKYKKELEKYKPHAELLANKSR